MVLKEASNSFILLLRGSEMESRSWLLTELMVTANSAVLIEDNSHLNRPAYEMETH